MRCLFLLLFWSGLLSAQQEPVYTWKGPPPCWSGAGPCQGMPKTAYMGEVSCDHGVPVPAYASDSNAHYNLERQETVKHETMHVAQLMGGCDSILAMWHRDTLVRLDAEVQATCAGLEVYKDSTTRARREGEAIRTLGMMFNKQLVSGDLYTAFTAWCHQGG